MKEFMKMPEGPISDEVRMALIEYVIEKTKGKRAFPELYAAAKEATKNFRREEFPSYAAKIKAST